MKAGRRKGGAAIPAVIDTGRRKRSNMAQPVFKSTTGRVKGGAAQNIIEITSEDLVQNGGQYKLIGGAPISMEMVAGRRSKQGAAQVVYPVDILGNYDPSFAGYIYKVLTSTDVYDASSLIGFWPQNELSGGVSIDYSGFGHDGAYAAVNLGQAGVPGMGMTSAEYGAAGSNNNVYSASLNALFSGTEGTLLGFSRVANVGVWTDGIARYVARFRVDANNRLALARSVANNAFSFTFKSGGVAESVTMGGLVETGWVAYAMTWDRLGVGFQPYYAGAPQGAPQAIAAAWVGNLDNTTTTIGAGSNVGAGPWDGLVAPVLLYNEAKTPAEITYLSVP